MGLACSEPDRSRTPYDQTYETRYNEPPPDPYEIPPAMVERHRASFQRFTAEKYIETLRRLQLVLLIDHSGSMRTPDQDGTGRPTLRNWRRWDNVIQLGWYLAQTCLQYDADGEIPVYMFGNTVSSHLVHNKEEFMQVLNTHTPTNQCTNLLEAMQRAFNDQLMKPDPMLFLIITDGQPNPGQEKEIKRLIKARLPAVDPTGDRVNLLFIRIGDDRGAIEFLRKLDDCKSIGNWVDTKSDNAVYQMGPENVLMNAIFEHLDDQFQNL